MARYRISKNPDTKEMFVSHGDVETDPFDEITEEIGIAIVDMPGEAPVVVTGPGATNIRGLDPDTIYTLQRQATIVDEYEEEEGDEEEEEGAEEGEPDGEDEDDDDDEDEKEEGK